MVTEEVINIRKTMKVTVSQSPDDQSILIWILDGFLDSYNSPDFAKSVNDYTDKGLYRIAFDCTNLNFISAEGLAVFTDIVKFLRQKGGDLLLINVVPKVRELFDMLGFTRFFHFAECDTAQIAATFNQMCHSQEPNEVSHFPIDVRCPHCKVLLKAHKSGKFKCSECKNILIIDNSGHISFS
ncbi:MAG: STAS domain-containing protein [Spirochaetales bacterium]|nr:STAS domain-containing protein [Spirochaetales bacterium]MBR6200774.1 STAS domain-containing protein [Spirochaetales bacterium]